MERGDDAWIPEEFEIEDPVSVEIICKKVGQLDHKCRFQALDRTECRFENARQPQQSIWVELLEMWEKV